MRQHRLSSKIAIMKYKAGSRSARTLQTYVSEKLQKNVLSIRSDRVPFLKNSRVLINWGSSDPLTRQLNCRIINRPSAVAFASDKILSLAAFKDKNVNCPDWTTDINVAEEWINNGKTVFCRTLTRAHSGRGIHIASTSDELVDAPLYTQYIKKQKEFRVHVFRNKVIDLQEKRRSTNSPDSDFLIRNHANGFVFCRDNIIEPTNLRSTALSAVAALGLDFGAVDIIYNAHYNKCYALEVNTAPGLEGTTLESYSNAIIKEAYV